MTKQSIYKIPNQFFFRLHHVRPRFKNDIEEVLLYVATSISELDDQNLSEPDFNSALNKVLFDFKKNKLSTQKTIDNWRTEIAALFSFIVENNDGFLKPSISAKRLAANQYLDEFFNYFLYSFQYPGGHIKPTNVAKQIRSGIKFKPCSFILNLLIEGEKILGKEFSVTAEELTQCAFFDLRVTTGSRSPKEVAELIIKNKKNKIEYSHHYEQLKKKDGSYPSNGDLCRYAGDILDYMVLANLLHTKSTSYYFYLNKENVGAIQFHIKSQSWFNKYDKFYGSQNIDLHEISRLENSWFEYSASFENIDEFAPKLDEKEKENISKIIDEYYQQMSGGKKVPTKIIGDYGENLIVAHEYLRTSAHSNRQHLINKIPTHFGVGYDIQSIEIEKKKRYIEVKTTKSRKAFKNNSFKLTPNEWDTAETIGENYFIYYLVVNETSKNVFIIQNPVAQYAEGNLVVDKYLVVNFQEKSGQWQKLLETKN